MSRSQIGLYGIGVMGRNLALNLEENGFKVSLFNREAPGEERVVQDFLMDEGKNKNFLGADTLESFVNSLESPRKILMMIKSGKPIDQVMDQLLPFLEENDVLIDGGNSHYKDTLRRIEDLSSQKIFFVGMGVSGGKEGARYGASLMPGGAPKAWPLIRPFLEKIAAPAFDRSPCCTWVGDGGAGHFIKMVHNGIEYADMQLLAEVYHILRNSLEMSTDEIAELFKQWNQTPLNSYLLEITSNILTVKDDDNQPLVDKILDSANEKGTGKWTAIEALEYEIPLPGISQAVFSRFISNFLDVRDRFSEFQPPQKKFTGDRSKLIHNLKDALLASRIGVYAEGFFLVSVMDQEFGWNMNFSSIAKIWQGGCIIRSILLKEIERAYKKAPDLKHLFLSEEFSSELLKLDEGWRSSISHAVQFGIPVPCMSAYLNLYDTLRSAKLPANLIQAQRDYFGAHTYERIDKPRSQFFHTDWENQ